MWQGRGGVNMEHALDKISSLRKHLPDFNNFLVQVAIFLRSCRYLDKERREEITQKIYQLVGEIKSLSLNREVIDTYESERQRLLAEREKLISDFDDQTIKFKDVLEEKKQLQEQIESLKEELTSTSGIELRKSDNYQLDNHSETMTIEMRQKLEQEISELIFGISNRIRNPLGIAQSNIELLLADKDIDKKTGIHLTVLLNQIERLENSLHEIHEITKPVIPIIKEIDISKLLDKALSAVSSLAQKQKVHILTDYARPAPRVHVDEKLTIEAFVQVALNAIEAMPYGGVLSVNSSLSKDKTTVSVVFSDTGIGIDPSHLSQVGKPFFTTKPNSSGLGLSLTKKFLANFLGTFSILRSSKLGTQVSITLPTNHTSEGGDIKK